MPLADIYRRVSTSLYPHYSNSQTILTESYIIARVMDNEGTVIVSFSPAKILYKGKDISVTVIVDAFGGYYLTGSEWEALFGLPECKSFAEVLKYIPRED